MSIKKRESNKAPATRRVPRSGEQQTRGESPRDAFVAEIIGVDLRRKEHLQKQLRQGFSIDVLTALTAAYGLEQKTMSRVLRIPTSTLTRRKKTGDKLRPSESDSALRYARLLASAVRLMEGDRKAASRWMVEPKALLNGESPLDWAETETGARDVENLIGRLEQGVFS
ncbi:MAG: DUF2384 domain-containing protein [OM182 bacterium]|jgi:putative toxin-antitoxin system antitoxin component (TIGR02293 family)|tara:strand:- start:656 stop:1162 length:507 start_codon:yes stop_codon:yes gene_type:complete